MNNVRPSSPPKTRSSGRSGTSIRPSGAPSTAVDENLSIGDVHVAAAVDGDTFAAAMSEGPQVTQCAVGSHHAAVSNVFRLAADIDAVARLGRDEAWVFKVSEKRQLRTGVGRPLLEHARRGQERAAIRRYVLPGLRRGHVLREHLRQCRVGEGVEVQLVFEFAVIPIIHRRMTRAPGRRFGWLAGQYGDLVLRRSGRKL